MPERMRLDTKALDGLRGFACMHIAVNHYIFDSSLNTGERWLDLNGGIAVALFFILSGYVMWFGYAQDTLAIDTRISQCMCWDMFKDNEGRKIDKYTFWVKRFARLAPMYYLSNLAAVLMVAFMLPSTTTIHTSDLVWTSAWSIPFLTSWVGVNPPNGVTWAVSTMLYFYISFPFIAPLVQRIPKAHLHKTALVVNFPIILVFMLLLEVAGREDALMALWYPCRMMPPLRLPTFILGMIAGRVALDREASLLADPQKAESREDTSQFGITHAVLALYFVMILLDTIPGLWLGFPDAIVYFYLIRAVGEYLMPYAYWFWVLALTGNRDTCLFAQAMRHKYLQFMGQISMSFYMIHRPVLQFFAYLFPCQPHIPGRFCMDFMVAVPAFALSVFLGWLSCQYVEIPAQQHIIRLWGEWTEGKARSDGKGPGRESEKALRHVRLEEEPEVEYPVVVSPVIHEGKGGRKQDSVETEITATAF